VWVLATANTFMPADFAARMPGRESSMTKHEVGDSDAAECCRFNPASA
jgi:hypothetical protein